MIFPPILPNCSQLYTAASNPMLAVTQFETNFRQRKKYSNDQERVQVGWLFNQFEFDVFKKFVRDLIKGGSDSFFLNIIGTNGLESREVQIVGGKYSSQYVSHAHHKVTCELLVVTNSVMTSNQYNLALLTGSNVEVPLTRLITPNASSFASLALTSNSILLTADIAGSGGNNISIEVLAASSDADLKITVSVDNKITAVPGQKGVMTINGAGPFLDKFGDVLSLTGLKFYHNIFADVSEANGKPAYWTYAEAPSGFSFGDYSVVRWTGSEWEIKIGMPTGGYSFRAFSTMDVATPDLVTSWTLDTSGVGNLSSGNIVGLTPSLTSRGQLIAALNYGSEHYSLNIAGLTYVGSPMPQTIFKKFETSAGKDSFKTNSGTDFLYWVADVTPYWYLEFSNGASWYSYDDVLTPNLVTTWIQGSDSEGFPNIVALKQAAELLTATSTGVVTGAIVAITEASLTNGADVITGSFTNQFCKVGASAPFTWFKWNGSAWLAHPDIPIYASLTAANAALANNTLFYDSTLSKLYVTTA